MRWTWLETNRHFRLWCSRRKSDYSRSTTEFNTGLSPLGVLNICSNLIDRELEGNYANRIGISLAEDSSQAGNEVRILERKVFSEDFDIFLDPLVADCFNLLKFGDSHRTFVREIEAEFGFRDQRALLVDVVAQYFSQTEVKDVCRGVVASDGSTTELRDKH